MHRMVPDRTAVDLSKHALYLKGYARNLMSKWKVFRSKLKETTILR